MKNFLKVFILAAGLVLFLNVNSFANVDIAAYGGYIFSGNAKVTGYLNEDFTGGQFGVKAHYNLELSDTIGLGLGGFFQYANISPDEGDFTIKRNALGIDIALLFMVSPEISPYIRANYSLSDKVKLEGWTVSGHGFGIGGGLEFAINQNVRIFVEMMYEGPSYKDSGVTMDVSMAEVNAGLKFMIE